MSLKNPQSYCWFQSGTRIGVVRIGIETSDTERDNLNCPHRVFQQAALVSASELTIQALELWQNLDLDLTPCSAPEDTAIYLILSPRAPESDQQSADSATQHVTEHRQVVAVLSGEALHSLSPLTDELTRFVHVDGSEVMMRVEIDHYAITAEECSKVEHGAVVLLPKSYETAWSVSAVSITPGVDLGIQGKMVARSEADTVGMSVCPMGISSSAGNSQLSDRQQVTDNEAGHELRVYCQTTGRVKLPDLLGNSGDTVVPVDTSKLDLYVDDNLYAHGSLLKYGDGQVLSVNQVI